MPWVRVVYRRGAHYGIAELFEPSAPIAAQLQEVLDQEPDDLSQGEFELADSLRAIVASELAAQRSRRVHSRSDYIVQTPAGAADDPWGYVDHLPSSP